MVESQARVVHGRTSQGPKLWIVFVTEDMGESPEVRRRENSDISTLAILREIGHVENICQDLRTKHFIRQISKYE